MLFEIKADSSYISTSDSSEPPVIPSFFFIAVSKSFATCTVVVELVDMSVNDLIRL